MERDHSVGRCWGPCEAVSRKSELAREGHARQSLLLVAIHSPATSRPLDSLVVVRAEPQPAKSGHRLAIARSCVLTWHDFLRGPRIKCCWPANLPRKPTNSFLATYRRHERRPVQHKSACNLIWWAVWGFQDGMQQQDIRRNKGNKTKTLRNIKKNENTRKTTTIL